jgi:cytosine/uracil/thiamine/allantoin permease
MQIDWIIRLDGIIALVVMFGFLIWMLVTAIDKANKKPDKMGNK